MESPEPAASRQEFRRRLAAAGEHRDRRLLEAFEAVPRDLFLDTLSFPKGLDSAAGFEEIPVYTTSWWRMMAIPHLSFPAVLTPAAPGRPQVPINASTAPLTLLRLLDLAALRDGQRVLHVGTGPGYLAGVLSARLGPANVTSIDLLEANVAGASRNLEKLIDLDVIAHLPLLDVANGHNGYPDRAPYDVIVSTMTPERIPSAWTRQLTDGGRVVTEIGGEAAGRVVVLEPDGAGQLSGRFADLSSNIMRDLTVSHDPIPATGPELPHPGTHLTENDLLYDDFLFFLQLHRSDLQVVQPDLDSRTDPLELRDRRGNRAWVWAFGEPGGRPYRVAQAGEEALWDVVEEAYCRWNQLGRPQADRLGMTTTEAGTQLWLEHPSVPLPMEFPPRSPRDSQRPKPTQVEPYEPFPAEPRRRALQAGLSDAEPAAESSFGRSYRQMLGSDPAPWRHRLIPGSRHSPRRC